MATLGRGITLATTETITNAKLHQLVDSGTVTGIVDADISASAAITGSKLSTIIESGKVGGTALSYLASIPSGAGYLPYQNLASIPANTLTNLSSLPTVAGQIPYYSIATIPSSLLGTGSPSASNFLRGDRSFQSITGIQNTSGIGTPKASVSSGGQMNQWYDVTNATTNITLNSTGTIFVTFGASVTSSANIYVKFRLVYNTSTVISTSENSSLLGTGVVDYIGIGGQATSVSPGTYAVKVQVCIDQASGTVNVSNGLLSVIAY